MSHIYQKSATIYPGGETWVPLEEAKVAEKAAEDRGLHQGLTFKGVFTKAMEGLSIDMARYKPILLTNDGEEKLHHFEIPPTSPDFKHKRVEIFDLSKEYEEFTLTGQELRNLMNGCRRDGREAERDRHRGEQDARLEGRLKAAKTENDARWEAKLKRALDEQANELLSKKSKEGCAAYADGQRDAAIQYAADKTKAVRQAYDDGRAEGLQAQAAQTTNDVLATYNRGLAQGRTEAKHEARRTSLRARDMLHMVVGLLRGDQPIAKGFLTSAIETLERM